MGLSASQTRFLQLTARNSDLEYQVQQINQERLRISDESSAASKKYNDAISNRTLMFSFNNGSAEQEVGLSYKNYKSYMNQQMANLSTTQEKYFLVSSSGNKIIAANEDDITTIINSNLNEKDEPIYTREDFIIVPDLDDVDTFQNAIREGIYYFATREQEPETGEYKFKTESWESIGSGGAISDILDTADDAQAEAEYENVSRRLQKIDKRLEMELSELETERKAIQTEMESISKVIDDNIEKSFKTFG